MSAASAGVRASWGMSLVRARPSEIVLVARDECGVGPHDRAIHLRPGQLALPAAARPRVSGGFLVPGYADPRPRRARRHPASRLFMADLQALPSPSRFWMVPTLTWWIGASDAALRTLCIAGAGLAVLLIAGFLPVVVLPALWLIYLSLSIVGGDFLSYQWDALLLETGVSGDLPRADHAARAHAGAGRSAAHRDHAPAVAAVPADGGIRRRQAGERRSQLAQPDSARGPLRDAADSDAAGLVCTPASALAAEDIDRSRCSGSNWWRLS